jgi:hypothetical protein
MLRYLLLLLCLMSGTQSVPSKVIIVTNVAKLKQYMKDIHVEKCNNTLFIHLGEDVKNHHSSFRDYVLQKIILFFILFL